MIFLYIFVFLVFIIAFLLFSKVKLQFIYDGEGKVILKYLFFKMNGEEIIEKIKNRKKTQNQTKIEEKEENKEEKPKKKGSIRGFLAFLKHITEVIKEAAKEFIKCLYIDVRKFNIRISTDDAAKTALVYGAAVSAGNALFEVMDRFTHLKKNEKEISMAPDFENEQTKTELDIVLKIRLWSLIRVGLHAYINFMK